MKMFVETFNFTSAVKDYLDDEAFAHIQMELMRNPNAGKVMPGCGGARKIRFSDPKRRKGKRGGVRIVYLHVPLVYWIVLLDIYGKDEKDDLSVAEKKF